MKKLLTLAFIFPFALTAQIPNSNFEEPWGCGGALKNWGTFFIQAVVIDSTGEMISDSITYDGFGFSGLTTDAHTGNYALEVRNAYNETAGAVLPGNATLFDDTEFPEPTGWNNGIILPENTAVTLFGFYYKFLPAGNDVVRATMEVFGESEFIGRVEFNISEAASEFTYIYAPLLAESQQAPQRVTIAFDMAAQGSEPAFGSRFIVDDVVVNESALGLNEATAGELKIWPSIASAQIMIAGTDQQEAQSELRITAASGKNVLNETITLSGEPSAIDVSNLAKGTYYVTVGSSSGKKTGTFIKQ